MNLILMYLFPVENRTTPRGQPFLQPGSHKAVHIQHFFAQPSAQLPVPYERYRLPTRAVSSDQAVSRSRAVRGLGRLQHNQYPAASVTKNAPLRGGGVFGEHVHRVFGHSSTTSVPFILLWPMPHTVEQRNWKVPALSAVNSTTTVVPLGIFWLMLKSSNLNP
jgi:hypothetical protein